MFESVFSKVYYICHVVFPLFDHNGANYCGFLLVVNFQSKQSKVDDKQKNNLFVEHVFQDFVYSTPKVVKFATMYIFCF